MHPNIDASEVIIEPVPSHLPLFLVARWRGQQAGVAVGDWESAGVLVIEDLRIEKDILLRRKNIFQKEKRMSLLRCGIGRGLLREVIRQAPRLGAIELVGKLAARDLEPQPFLPDWYAREGFEILPPNSHDPSWIRGRIRMQLYPG